MDFFNNQGDNSKQNEDLLDAIMEQQKKRESKHNIQKGYLLKKDVGKVSNPFNEKNTLVEDFESEPEGEARDFEHKPIEEKEPMFLVSNKYTGKKQLSAKAKKAIIISAILSDIMIVLAFCLVFFLTKHEIEIVCSSREGIVLYDERGKEFDTISLRMNESIKFKVEVKPSYSNSKVEVWYNDKLLTGTSAQDKYGYYTIKYTGETNQLRIMGVVENDYDIKFDDNANFNYRITKVDGTTEWGDGKTFTNFFGNKIKFTLYDVANGNVLPQHLACVYDNGVLLNPNANNEYEVSHNANHNLVSYFHSPFEWFKINTKYKEDDANVVEKVEVVGLTDLGENKNIIKFPVKQGANTLAYSFAGVGFYDKVSELIVSNGMNFTTELFDSFTDLQKITVANPRVQPNTYYSENGLLYFRSEQTTISGMERVLNVSNILVKVPMGVGKNLAQGARILTINPDIIGTGAIYRLNYIRTLILGNNVSAIEPLALKNTYGGDDYTIMFEGGSNPNFTINNGMIYATNGALINAQLAKGDIVIPTGAVIGEAAFAYSAVKNITFEGTATIGAYAFSAMDDLEKVVLNSNIGSISAGLFSQSNENIVIDLRNVTGVITISEQAALFWDDITIVVSDLNLEAYRTQNETKAFANCFVGASEFDAN